VSRSPPDDTPLEPHRSIRLSCSRGTIGGVCVASGSATMMRVLVMASFLLFILFVYGQFTTARDAVAPDAAVTSRR
jgi:hypothetical protein